MRVNQVHPNKYTTIALVITSIIIVIIAVVIATRLLGFWEPEPIARIVGSGNFGAQNQHFTDSRPRVGIAIQDGFQVRITKSDTYNTTIIADDNMFDYLDVYQTVDTLVLGLKSGYSYKDVTLRAEVTMPSLEYMELSGKSNCIATGFGSCNYFTLSVSEESNVTIEGSASFLSIVASDASRLDLSEFHVEDVDVYIMSGSGVIVSSENTLTGIVAGDSHLKYVGNPEITITNWDSTVGPK
jgi:hypothetical protein